MNHGHSIGLRVVAGWSPRWARHASTLALASVNGTIQSARTSLTVVAIVNATAPNFVAAPTTELVSWIARAAHNPNSVSVRPSARPQSGNRTSPSAFNRNTVPIDTDISSSRAPITGPV